MDSNSHQNYQPQQQPNSGLLRFRSAPSSFLANFTEALDSSGNKGNTWENSESERLISRFVNYSENSDTTSLSFQELEDKPSKARNEASLNLMNSHAQQAYSGLPPHYPRHNSTTSSPMDNSFGLGVSMGMDQETQSKSFGSHLLRQSSSPAGLFSNISFQNGYGIMKDVGNYGGMNSSNCELSPTMNGLKNQISFPSRTSSLGVLSQISEIGSEDIGPTSPNDGKLAATNGFGSAFSYGSWNNTSHLSENLSGLKRDQSNCEKLFSDAQNGELGNRVHVLSHHLSLPKTSADIAAMEKFLQFPDAVPCKIRAKRGCATHPRSIAERVRRTRISERMRKLQELVPNMDKQTNTADMLDLAVEYIKDLQKQYKIMSEKRSNCKCMSMQKPDKNQIV
ncbi:hypothetical protein L6164_009427 [Bauhinia variegata]|uniref:Uncharacterized protein n=1 Tax=Bauhinia variegata TaxID=167791 RepID=A0ACB9PLC0_BAUVA|nr:hypothetical protein L6164_009427 [Bauhinia variegata]